jgi:hypothetical protein
MTKHWVSTMLALLAVAWIAPAARAQSCTDEDVDCTDNIWYDSSTGMINGIVSTDY